MIAESKQDDEQQVRRPTAFSRRVYLLLVTASAIGLLGLACSSLIPANYTATSTVCISESPEHPPGAGLISLDNLISALRQVDRTLSQADSIIGARNLQQRLAVHWRPASQLGEGSLEISCADRDPFRAAALANVVARQFAAEQMVRRQSVNASEHTAAIESVRMAREAADDAQSQLDAFIAKQLSQMVERSSHETSQIAAKPQAVEKPVNMPLVALRQQLETLLDRREQLLTQLMPLHPAVKDVDDQIRSAREQLGLLESQQADSGPALSQPPPPAVDRPVTTTQHEHEHRRLLAQRNQSWRVLEQHRELERSLWEHQLRAQLSGEFLVHPAVKPSAPDRETCTIVLTAILVLGLWVGITTASLGDDSGEEIPRLSRFAKFTTFASELVLAAFGVGVIALAICDRDFAMSFLFDPLSALRQTIQRAAGI